MKMTEDMELTGSRQSFEFDELLAGVADDSGDDGSRTNSS